LESQSVGTGTLLLIGLMWALNLVISIANAYFCGRALPFAKLNGGWLKVLVYSGITMSTCGFAWCLLIPVALGCHFVPPAFGYEAMPMEYVKFMLQVGYIVIIGPVLVSGLFITIDSWIQAVRNPGLLTGGTAVYNTWAMVHNATEAMTAVPKALSEIGEVLSKTSSGDDKGWGGYALLLVGLCLVSAFLLTWWIVSKSAKASARKFEVTLSEMRAAKASDKVPA
jgi:hypothetical protein